MLDNKTLLGNAGEKMVANYFSSKNIMINLSVDPFDRVKDLKINGDKTLEIKTQVPFVSKKCFTIKDNHQLQKCLNADYLVFVQAPCSKLDEAGIYQVEKGFKHFKYITKAGIKMILLSMNQTAVVKLGTIEGKDKEVLRKYATPY